MFLESELTLSVQGYRSISRALGFRVMKHDVQVKEAEVTGVIVQGLG
jgi:hypothetical protein